jgi:2,4-dienoyl-CoA reductase-like NADH-dependent reductase (Old Yellow Enzyme family)/thioredoxin reductase
MQYATSKNRPMPDIIAYYERKAMGGAASVCVGDAVVDSETALSIGNHILLDDVKAKASLNKLSDAITKHGAIASMELCHGGNAAVLSYQAGHTIYGPSETDFVNAKGIKVHASEMTREVMDRTIRKHADAAAFVKSCGFDMITIHAGHGWLLYQFMSPTTNRRTDEYGGNIENNMRFPLEVLHAVREAVGAGFPIEIRISGSEVFEGGYGIEYGIAIAKALDGVADIIHVSAGSHENDSVFTVTHPSMFLEDGVNVKYAAEIKKHVKKSAVATVGALSDPAMMEEIIASGKADIVEAARALFCDPYLPLKARIGKQDDITKCMRCFHCYSNLMTKGHITCALNPEISAESEVKFERAAANKKTVLIAGGGIGGMQTALTASKRGHDVILCEKTDALGGVLRCEENVPFKKHLHEYLELQARRVSRAPIDVRLNTAVTAEYARSIAADVIVAAIGSEPFVPPIKGIDLPHVLSAEDAYAHPEKIGRSVVILGGGLVGIELAIYLSELGQRLEILEMDSTLNDGGNIVHRKAFMLEIENRGIGVFTGTKAVEITRDGVLAEKNGAVKLFDAETVVTAMGRRPLRDECEALSFCAPEFHRIGDCITPKNIAQATRAAYFIALDIGAV